MDSFFGNEVKSWSCIDVATNEHVALLTMEWNNPYTVLIHGYARNPAPRYKGLGKRLLSHFLETFGEDLNIWFYAGSRALVQPYLDTFDMCLVASPNVEDVDSALRTLYVPYSYHAALVRFCNTLGLEHSEQAFLEERRAVVLCTRSTATYELLGVESTSAVRKQHRLQRETTRDAAQSFSSRWGTERGMEEFPSCMHQPLDVERDYVNFEKGYLNIPGFVRGEDGWYSREEDL